MAKHDRDLFDRLRQAGLRKQVAKTLSEIGEGASKKAQRAAHAAVGELRSLADELERRLPVTPNATAEPKNPAARASRSRATRAAAGSRSGAGRRRTAAARSTPPAAGNARAPRGQNKAKILASLKAGPRTASEIASETGISTGTVSSTLTKLATSGEVAKADRGYALPS
jgi:DNA-binding transcriptional ArsR family regulator